MSHNNEALRSEIGEIESLIGRMETIFKSYTGDVFSDDGLRTIRGEISGFSADASENLREGRLLRLGIVGQIKAGKSSLLNLLLFDGREILPKAATPMTASLTHIVKDDKDVIEVEYYSREDWREIEGHSRAYEARRREIDEYDRDPQRSGKAQPAHPDPFMESSHELVEMAKTIPDLGRYLDMSEPERIEVTLDSLNQELTALVGSGGRLTPLVKSVTIRCSQGIPDLDIVDTPGINDPIRSRVRRAEQMLKRCDAVLMLSYAGQFMDKEDTTFMLGKVAKAGIDHRLLLGSKFDSALLDVSRQYKGDLDTAIGAVRGLLSKHAMKAIASSGERPGGGAPLLKESDIYFVSAFCANLTRRRSEEWSDDERDIFDKLRAAYRDYLDEPVDGEIDEATKKHLADVGAIDAVEGRLEIIRGKTEEIIADKARSFVARTRETIEEELNGIIKDTGERRDELQGADRKEIEKQIGMVEEIGDSIRDQIEECWADAIEKGRDRFRELKATLRSETQAMRGTISGAASTQTKRETVDKGAGFLWWRSLVGKRYETVTYEEHVLNMAEIASAMENMADRIRDQIEDIQRRLFDRSTIKQFLLQVARVVSNELDDEIAAQINPKAITRAVRQGAAKIAEDARGRLSGNRFEVEVDLATDETYDDVKGGQQQARALLRRIADQVDRQMSKSESVIDATIDQCRKLLLPETTKQLKAYLEQLQKDLEQKEFLLQRYDMALKALAGLR